MAIADKYGIPVVEDAAEGMGSYFEGKVLGTFGKYGVLAFNGNKMITTSGVARLSVVMRRMQTRLCGMLPRLAMLTRIISVPQLAIIIVCRMFVLELAVVK